MEFKLPELGEGVYEAEIVRWHVKPGDTVRRAQTLLEVLTDKATMEVPSPFAGKIDAVQGEPGAVVKVGDAILKYSSTGEEKAEETQPPRHEAKRTPTPVAHAVGSPRSANGPAVTAAPSVRLMARKLGVDLSSIRGSGPNGRILIEDVAKLSGRPEGTRAAPAPRPDFGKPGSRLKLQGIRRKIAEHMTLAKQTIPHYSYVDECDVTDLVRLRTSLKEHFADSDVRITYLAFFVKAAVAALKEVPIVNASLEDNEIVLHDRYHIGIAVDTPSGLMVPVIHDADKKDFLPLAKEIERLSSDARAGKSKLDDLKGATFTITSIGNIGGLISTPIIPPPQAAILGVGKIAKRPIIDEQGQMKPAEMVYLSLSFDHRILDGAVGAAFCNALIHQLRSPAALLLPT